MRMRFKRLGEAVGRGALRALSLLRRGVLAAWRLLCRWMRAGWCKTAMRVGAVLLLSGVAILLSAVCVSAAVCDKTEERVLSLDRLAEEADAYDCVLVLGCRVYADGSPSPMLADRMETAVEVMEAGASEKMVVSGDHRVDSYNEVKAMKDYAVMRGIPSEAVFQDHDGYSTYDSIYRIKEVFGAKRIVIVTQEYHLYRALYLAEKLGIEAVGVAADRQPYAKQRIYEAREIFARCKDVYFGLLRPSSVAECVPVSLQQSGDVTAESRPVDP